MEKKNVSVGKIKQFLSEEIDRIEKCIDESQKKRDFLPALEYSITQEVYLFLLEAISGTNDLYYELLEGDDE